MGSSKKSEGHYVVRAAGRPFYERQATSLREANKIARDLLKDHPGMKIEISHVLGAIQLSLAELMQTLIPGKMQILLVQWGLLQGKIFIATGEEIEAVNITECFSSEYQMLLRETDVAAFFGYFERVFMLSEKGEYGLAFVRAENFIDSRLVFAQLVDHVIEAKNDHLIYELAPLKGVPQLSLGGVEIVPSTVTHCFVEYQLFSPIDERFFRRLGGADD